MRGPDGMHLQRRVSPQRAHAAVAGDLHYRRSARPAGLRVQARDLQTDRFLSVSADELLRAFDECITSKGAVCALALSDNWRWLSRHWPVCNDASAHAFLRAVTDAAAIGVYITTILSLREQPVSNPPSAVEGTGDARV